MIYKKRGLSQRYASVELPPYNCKGDGVTDDIKSIEKAIFENDVIFFPENDYGTSKTMLLENIKGKTFIFENGARIVRVDGDKSPVVTIKDSSDIDFYNIGVHAINDKVASNAILIRGSHDINFYGKTKIEYTDSISFVLRANTHKLFIDTLIIDHPLTRDGLSLMNCHDITVNTVIGKSNNDDLVVLKAVGGSTYNIKIGKIHAQNCFGTFSIGSEVWDGNIYNVTVGEILAYGCRRGPYFKLWNDHTNIDRGKVHDIYIGTLVFYNDQTGDSQEPSSGIFFENQHDDWKGYYHNIHFGKVFITGSFLLDMVYIQRAKKIIIDDLTLKSLIPDTDTRSLVNRYGIYLRDGTTDCEFRNGTVEGLDVPIYNHTACHNNTFKNIKPIPVNRDGLVNVDATALISIKLADHCKVIDCDLSEKAVKKIELIDDLSASPTKTTIRRGNNGRDAGASLAPTDGQYYQGDRIPNSEPTAGGFSEFVCVDTGTPGKWQGAGRLEDFS